MNFINNLGLALVVGVGGWMAVQGLATVGTIASFINYTRQFGRPLNELANLYNLIQAAVAGVERVFEVIEQVNSEGTPVLLIEQNASMALQAADRGYVIETGEIVLEDEAKRLLGNDQVRKAYLGEE